MSNTPSEMEETTTPDSAGGLSAALQEKVTEYTLLVGPVEQAIREMQFTRGMLRARAEDELNSLSPRLAALSEALEISTLDLLMAPDRGAFLREAVTRAGLPLSEVQRLLTIEGESGSHADEELLALEQPEEAEET